MDPSASAPSAPPRLGGASPPLDLVEITPNALQIGALASRVVCPTAGGIATFTGTTRDHFEGKQVVRLEYEAYGAMAEKEIRAICGRMRARWALRHIAFAHRTGVVPTCEASVEIAVSSTHRKEALEAVQYAIDELKAHVPIWKKEVYDGEAAAAWKENPDWARGGAGKSTASHAHVAQA
jgi:molybdopterin synthase catalytic subunit